MNKCHIPFDLIFQDGENGLHEMINKDPKFAKYLQAMKCLIDSTIKSDTLKAQISEACGMIYIFAEIAAYKEGFKEGIRFLVNVLSSTGSSGKTSKRDKDFNEALERFLTET